MPVGEAGGSKGQGQTEPEGDHPACTERSEGRLGKPARLADHREASPLPGARGWPLSKATAEGSEAVAASGEP